MESESTKAPWPLPKELDVPANRALSLLLASRRLSAHSDLFEPLARVDRHLDGLAEIGRYFPAPESYSYALRYAARGGVFLVAYGMHGLSLRVGLQQVDAACRDGAKPDPVLGAEWVQFDVFTTDDEGPLLAWSERALALVD
jgi:hypothetical protein